MRNSKSLVSAERPASGEDGSPVVQVDRLFSGYEGVPVLKDVSLTAREHEITVVLGSSGCGKTTLLKNLIRLNAPDRGSIRLFGREITSMEENDFSRILARIGVLFQNGALLNSLPVWENVAIPLEQHTDLPVSIIRRLARMKLRLVELEEAQNKLPSELSGGMRKRAALARAMALDPPLLFCDEPTSGLDPITSAALDELILKLRDEQGITWVIVSHDVPSILRIADRVVFMDRGEVIFCGPLNDAISSGLPKIDDFFTKGTR
jgi:phospholipid/cholesterol/gamma-HCH transport system ATP-binding protein